MTPKYFRGPQGDRRALCSADGTRNEQQTPFCPMPWLPMTGENKEEEGKRYAQRQEEANKRSE